MTCQRGVVDGTTGTAPGRALTVGETVGCVGQGGAHGEYLSLPLKFAVNLKLILKIRSMKIL